MLTNKEIGVLCYCRGCLNRKCGLDLERSDIKHLKMLLADFCRRAGKIFKKMREWLCWLAR